MKCPDCLYTSKEGKFESRNLLLHRAKMHDPDRPKNVVKLTPKAEQPLEIKTLEPKPPVDVIFYCPRHPFITVIVVPDEWRMVTTPNGEKLMPVPGLKAEFDSGAFTTTNPLIIAYLEGDVEEAKKLGLVDTGGRPRVYKDARSPIISNRQMKAMVSA